MACRTLPPTVQESPRGRPSRSRPHRAAGTERRVTPNRSPTAWALQPARRRRLTQPAGCARRRVAGQSSCDERTALGSRRSWRALSTGRCVRTSSVSGLRRRRNPNRAARSSVRAIGALRPSPPRGRWPPRCQPVRATGPRGARPVPGPGAASAAPPTVRRWLSSSARRFAAGSTPASARPGSNQGRTIRRSGRRSGVGSCAAETACSGEEPTAASCGRDGWSWLVCMSASDGWVRCGSHGTERLRRCQRVTRPGQVRP